MKTSGKRSGPVVNYDKRSYKLRMLSKKTLKSNGPKKIDPVYSKKLKK